MSNQTVSSFQNVWRLFNIKKCCIRFRSLRGQMVATFIYFFINCAIMFYNLVSIDMQQIIQGNRVANVSSVGVKGYMVNFYEAEKLCRLTNAYSVASYNQLYAAWEAGLQLCQ